MKTEPTLICYSVLAAVNAVQIAAFSMPTWLHVAIIAGSAGLTAFVNRSQVTPATKAAPPAG